MKSTEGFGMMIGTEEFIGGGSGDSPINDGIADEGAGV